jgi:hypothetical protein
LAVPALQSYRFANVSRQRRRAIRYIFLAKKYWKFRNAKKDVAAVAHPKSVTKIRYKLSLI